MTLRERLSEYIRACFTGIWIESHEHQDAITEIAQLCRDEQWQVSDLEYQHRYLGHLFVAVRSRSESVATKR